MAYYAFLDKHNTVVEIITGQPEDEGIYDWEFYYSQEKRLKCKRTSYNTRGGVHVLGGEPFRKNFAEIGGTYDESRDAFIPPKSYPSWVLNESTCQWEPPVSAPENFMDYKWNEDTQTWDLAG